jgi:hypothetical protein
MLNLSSASQIRHRFAHRCGVGVRNGGKKKSKNLEFPAHADADLRLSAKKKRFQGIARIRMPCASGFGLGRPRAAAHGWGKVARILTEINRLPQFHPVSLTRNPGRSGSPTGFIQFSRARSLFRLFPLPKIRRGCACLDAIIQVRFCAPSSRMHRYGGLRRCSCLSARSSSSSHRVKLTRSTRRRRSSSKANTASRFGLAR